MVAMIICHLQWNMESKTEFPLLMYRLFVKIKHLPLLSTVYLPLVEFTHILTAFYHPPISLVLFTNLHIDAPENGHVGLDYVLN